jgi:hypothetical protein
LRKRRPKKSKVSYCAPSGGVIAGAFKKQDTTRHSPPAAKEASLAKDVSPVVATATADAKASKPHKPKLLARQRNNYERPDYYGTALGYAQESRNGPQRLFANW